MNPSQLLPPASARRHEDAAPSDYARALAAITTISIPAAVVCGSILFHLASSLPDLAVSIIAALPGSDAAAATIAEAAAEAAAEAEHEPPPLYERVGLGPLVAHLTLPRILLAATLLAGFAMWRMLARTRVVMTDTHLYSSRATSLAQTCTVTPLDQITSIRHDRGPIDRLFGTSSLTLHTRGDTVHLFGLTNPLPIVEAFRARTTTPTLPVVAAEEDAPAWSARLSPRGLASAVTTHAIAPILLIGLPGIVDGGAATRLNMLLLGIILALAALVFTLSIVRSRYSIQGGSVRVARTLLGKSDRRMDIARIADVEIRRPPLARLFRCGHVVVRSESGEKLTLYGLSDPDAARDAIDQHRFRSVTA